MNDQKLKIRIQLQHQAQSADQPQSIDALNPAIENSDRGGNLPFNRQKILLALLLMVFIVGLVSYLIIWWNDEGQPLAEIDPVVTAHKTITPPLESPREELAVIEIDNNAVNLPPLENEIKVDDNTINTVNLPPIENGTVVDQAAPETTLETNLIPKPKRKEKAIPIATDILDETTQSADSSLNNSSQADQPQVIRAHLTNAINQREPIDIIENVWLDKDAAQKVFFFIQVRDLTGQSVSVNWYYQDKLVAKVPLKIGGNNWRTYASKMLHKNRLGTWHVALRDHSGNLLAQRSFTVSSRS